MMTHPAGLGDVGLHIITKFFDEEHNYAIKIAFKKTNNEAKYKALLERLPVARLLGAT